MKSKKTRSYPGFSILLSFGSFRKPKFTLESYEFKISILFFTIAFIIKDLDSLLDSYHDQLLYRIKELEEYGNKG